MIKIYVHNFFSIGLLKKLTHNCYNLKIENLDNSTTVFCSFKNINFEFVFNPEINFNNDGFHLIEYYDISLDPMRYKNYLGFTYEDHEDESKIYRRIYEKIKNEKNWIIFVIRTEKLLTKIDLPELDFATKDEYYLMKLNNHFVVNDGVFINKTFENYYSNFYSVFTSTLFHWNEYCGMYWFNDFSKIYNSLKFEYDLAYCVKRIKKNRKEILKHLSKLNNPKIFLSITDYGGRDLTNIDEHFEDLNLPNIHFNSMYGNSDFSNVSYLPNFYCPGVDVFFRVLPKAKMQILDESWAHYKKDYIHNYLSEKTFGLILAGIPFISTHNYPLDILESVLKTNRHPFYEESKQLSIDPKNFTNFVNNFMENFDENFKKCLEWSIETKSLLLDYINNNNDFLQLIIDNRFTNKSNQKSLL